MPIDLPEPISAYIAAENAGDPDALVRCFAADAVIRDEGRAIAGLEAIRAWQIANKARYRHSVEPLAAVEAEGRTVVTARVAGSFPGSPVELDFAFGLSGGRIATLEIG